MCAQILDGREAREALLPKLIEKIRRLPFVPTLAIIQVGERPDSNSYIRAKKNFAEKIEVKVRHIQVPENIPQADLIQIIEECNADSNIQGIIVQLPIPAHLDRDTVINTIDPKKDVDALTVDSIQKWSEGEDILSATARGVRELLNYYKIDLHDKKVTVVGRSELVGKPIATMCKNEGAVVTVCHSKTVDLGAETKPADIIICAVGKPELIRAEYVREGQIIVDVGINEIFDESLENESKNGLKAESNKEIANDPMRRKLVGDVDFESVKNIVAAITPVPGGVGQMTVLALFENLADICSSK